MASGGSAERHAAAGKAGAAKRGTPEAPAQSVLRRPRTCRLSNRCALRNVCRAGFAGRGTTAARFIEPHSRFPCRPETESRVAQRSDPNDAAATCSVPAGSAPRNNVPASATAMQATSQGRAESGAGCSLPRPRYICTIGPR